MSEEQGLPVTLVAASDEADAFELTMTPRPEPAIASAPGTPESPLDAIEPFVIADAGDDVLRARYLELAEAAGEQLRAASALARAAGANEPEVRERVWRDAGTLFWQEAELPRARSAFLQAVLANAGGPAGLAAARRVLDLEPEPGDPDAIGPALDLIVRADPAPSARHDAAAKLLSLDATAPQDATRLTHALRALADSSFSDRVGSHLASIHETSPQRAAEIALHALESVESDASAPPLDRSGPLIRSVALFRRGTVHDLAGAADAWRRLLEEEPGDTQAVEALVDLGTKTDPSPQLLEAVARACPALPGPHRRDLMLRTGRSLLRHGLREKALDMCRELLDDRDISLAIAHSVAEIAHDEDEAALYRAALEVQHHIGGDETKKRALERLGDFQFTQLRDAPAAAESWRAAARMWETTPADANHARSLYERALNALPDDRDAAGRLCEIYRLANDWTKLPGVLRVLVRTENGGEGAERLLLDVEKEAIEAGAAEDYVSLLDQALTRGDATPGRVRPLKRGRARALGAMANQRDTASSAYRELVETFGRDEDVRDFEAFIDSRPIGHERHLDRRWLYSWRAERDPQPAKVLLDWARAEDEFGQTDAATTVYQRLADSEPGRTEALEALCRLKLHGADFEGGLAALRLLHDAGAESDRQAVVLRIARLLLEDMHRPAEAVLAVAPLLGIVPAVAQAHEILRGALADPASRSAVVERLEKLADDAEPSTRLRVYEFLVSAREETASTAGARQRWFQKIVELSPEPASALDAAIRGATEFPSAAVLWDAAEQIARTLGQAAVVSGAYHRVLVERKTLEATAAEALARRMVTFEAGCGVESPRLVEALLKTLEVAPTARWALDRVKLVLGSQARWDELFPLYDRAINAAADESTRDSLLDEAAFAAKDLATLPDRAIVYLEAIHRLRPADRAVDTALERLYERQRRTSALITLLDERLSRCTGFQRREVFRRIAALWLDLGRPSDALKVVERILAEPAPVAEVADLLERVALHPARADESDMTAKTEGGNDDARVAAQRRAVALVRTHYETEGKTQDLVRMAERELALADDAEQRFQCVRELVRLRLLAAEAIEGGVFEQVVPRVADDVAGDPALAIIAFESLLQRALQTWKQPASPAKDDAAEGAWRIIHQLKALLVDTGKVEGALHLLASCSRLPFERHRRRDLVRQAGLVCAETLGDSARAVPLFADLFEEDGGDEVAIASLSTFVKLLESSGDHARLATLWEAQAAVHASAGRPADQRDSWERAGQLWQHANATGKAIAAFGEAGALGSEAAFEALAKIHSEQGNWTKAAEALEWLVAHAAPQARGVRALHLANAYVELGDRCRARACLEATLSSDMAAAGSEDVPERLIGLYREDRAWEPLARLLAAQARRPGQSQRRVGWLREAADLHWRKLAQPAEAAALLELAVSWNPKDVELRPALAEVLEALDRWQESARVLKDQVELYRDQRSKERALTHHRLARALTRACKADEALTELRTASEMHPGHPAILYDLGRAALSAQQLDLAEGTYRTLLLALHHSIEGADENGDEGRGTRPPHRAEVFVELSEVAVLRADEARALELVDSAVDAAFESGDDPQLFERLLAMRGRYALLARSIESRVERATTLAARASALRDLAQLWGASLDRAEDLGARIARHAERMGRELEHEGLTDAEAWTALAEAHGFFGDERARLTMLQRRAALLASALPKLEPGEQRARLRLELARFYLEDPNRAEEAIALLSNALEDSPGERETIDRLTELLERLERFDELVLVLEPRFRAAKGDSGHFAGREEFADVAWRLARALDRSGRDSDALPVYESLVDSVSDNRDRLDALVERLEALGSPRLGDALERKLAVGGDGVRDAAERLLALRERNHDADGTIRALELGFAADPANTAFFCRLVDAYRETGDENATLRLLDPAIAARPDDAQLRLLRAKAREALGDDGGALSDLEAAAAADLLHVDSLLALHERVLARLQSAGPGEAGEVAAADANALRLVDLLLHAKRLDDARAEIDRVLRRNPVEAGALERLAAMHATAGDWDRALETYERLLPLAETGDRATLVRVVLAMADVCERAGDAGAARVWLERALVKAPDSEELMQRLEHVYEVTGDVTRLADLLASHAERNVPGVERTRLYVRAGTLLLETAPPGAQDPARALALADRARAGDPESLEALLLCATAQRRLGRPHEAIGGLSEAIAKGRGKRTPLFARVHLERAKAHLALDELSEAFDSLKAAFALDWRSTEIATLLALVALDLDDDKLAERALSGLSAIPGQRTGSTGGEEATQQASAFYRLAVLAQARGDRGKAKRMASRAIAIDSGHAAARTLLEQLDPGTNRSGARPAAPPRS